MAKKGKKCSSAGKALAECRWHKGKGRGKGKAKAKKSTSKKPKPKPKAKPGVSSAKPRAPVRQSRRIAGKVPVRQPEPTKKGKGRKKPDYSRAPAKSSFKAERFLTCSKGS
jgi:hypothetical protein